MSFTKNLFAKKMFKYVLIALAIVVGLHLVLQILNILVFHENNLAIFELSNRFDLDDESSVPTWFSSVLLGLTSVAAFVAAWFETHSRQRRALLAVVATVAGIFSIDEIATIHEYVLVLLHRGAFGNADSTLLHNGWILVAPFVLIIGIALAWWIFRTLPRRTFVLLAVAGFVFLAGSMGVEVVTNAMTFGPFVSQGLLVAWEEGFELLGTAIALYAIVDYIETNHGARFAKAFKILQKDRK